MSTNFSTPYPNQTQNYIDSSKQFLSPGSEQIYITHSQDPTTNLDTHFFEKLFIEAIHIAEERNVPLYCGEYGVIDKADPISTLNWYKDIHSVFEKYNISRAAWTYKEMDFGITQKHCSSIIEQLVKLL